MCEPTQKLSVAVELLDRALVMFFDGNSYFAAINLAGGAEEILGVYVSRTGEDSSSKSLQQSAVRISKFSDDGRASSPKDINFVMNYARNRTKHQNDVGDDEVHFDPKVEAFDLLHRAVSNYYALMRHHNLPLTDIIERFNSERGKLEE